MFGLRNYLTRQPLYLARMAAPYAREVEVCYYMRPDVWLVEMDDSQVYGPGFIRASNGAWQGKGMSHSDAPTLAALVEQHYPTIPDGGYLDRDLTLLWGHHSPLPQVPSNWGHFIWTYLLRLVFEGPTPLLVSDKVPDRFLDWARRIGFDEFVKAPDGVRVRHLTAHSTLARRMQDQTPAVLPSAVYALRNRLGIGLPRNPRPKLYVSRQNADWRNVVNEDDLIEALLPLGFSVITPETMSVGEQIDVIGRAGLIVMPIGGASPITMLAPEDCQIVELGYADIKGPFASAIWADLLGQRYVRVNGEPQGEQRGYLAIDRDYKIDIDEVVRHL